MDTETVGGVTRCGLVLFLASFVWAAKRTGEIDPGEGNWAQAKLTEERKEYVSAEQHLQRAIETAPQQARVGLTLIVVGVGLAGARHAGRPSAGSPE